MDRFVVGFDPEYGIGRFFEAWAWSLNMSADANFVSKSPTYHKPVRTGAFGALNDDDDDDDANCGCPSLLFRGAGFGVASGCDCSSTSFSSAEIIIDCDSGLFGPLVVAPENGSGCKEQTNRASTATDRSKAQKSCAPKSRDPCSVSACFLKSSRDSITSALDSIAS